MATLRPPPSPSPGDANQFTSVAWQQWFARLPASVDVIASSATITQSATGYRYANNGASINRLNDRLFLAEATVNDGANPCVTEDWLTTFQLAAGATVGSLTLTQSGILSGSSVSTFAAAFLSGAESLGSTLAATNCIGLQAFAINNNTTVATKAWGIYAEAHKILATAGTTTVAELSTRTILAAGGCSPYLAGTVVGLTLSSGANLSAVGQFDASCAIQILAKPMKYSVGLAFGATSIIGTDGTGTGTGTAIALARGHKLDWFNSAGTVTSSILGDVATAANATKLLFNDTGFTVTDTASAPLALFPFIGSAVNYFSIGAAAAAGTPTIAALGSDTNIPIKLDSKGTGKLILGHTGMKVQFGTYVGGAPAATGYIIIEDYSGTQYKLLTST